MTRFQSRLNGLAGLLLAVLALGGCGGSGGTADSAKYSIEIDRNSLDFTYSPGGAAPAEQIVSVEYDGDGMLVGYAPGQSQPAWLDVRQVDNADTTSPVDIGFAILTGGLGTGVYRASVRFATGDAGGKDVAFVDLDVFLAVANRLNLDQDSMAFSHTDGAAVAPSPRTLTLSGSGIDWTAAASASWLTLDSTSGVAPSTIEVGIDPGGLASGEYQASLFVTEVASGLNETVDIQLLVEPHRLFIGDNGIAFSSFPTAQANLEHSIRVIDNADANVSWSASSDQAWLNVTAAGVSGGDLTLTADPNGLATDNLYFAEVTVTSPATSIVNSETVQVGFYVAAADPVLAELAIAGRYLVADPIRPYAYLTNLDSDIEIYHIYTGGLVDTITAGNTLKAMAISSDGRRLFVGDAGDQSILPIDLDGFTPGAKWPADDFSQTNAMLEFMRINGRDVVITHRREVFDADSGVPLAIIPHAYFTTVVLAAAANGHDFYLSQPGVSGIFDLLRYRADYSWVTDSLSISEQQGLNRSFANLRDIATNRDGTKVYSASGGEYTFPTFLFDGNAISEGTVLAGAPFPLAVELGPTEKLYGGINAFQNTTDMWSYLADDGNESSYLVSGKLHDRQLRISGDGLRLLSLSDAPALSATAIVP